MIDVAFMSDDNLEDDFMVEDDQDDEEGFMNDEDSFGEITTKKKKQPPAILKESTNQSKTVSNKRAKNIEETYQKLTPHEVSYILSEFGTCCHTP
jgi:hypothetical protein